MGSRIRKLSDHGRNGCRYHGIRRQLRCCRNCSRRRYSKEILPEYFSGKIENVDDIEYRELYGREIPDGSWSGEIQMNDAVCQLYYGKGIFGKLFYGVLKLLLKISEWQGKPNLNVLFNYNMPIRGICKNDGWICHNGDGESLTEMANGHRIKGTAHLIKAAVKRD